MKDLALIVIHIFATTAKLLGPGDLRAVVTENALLRQQLAVLRRSRRRAPNLTALDRFLFGFGSLFLRSGRVSKIAVGLRSSTFLKFHQALVRGKYHRLFSSNRHARKPGPRGPDEALIRAIVELKSRNPRFGCPRIALIITRTFGIEIDKNVVRRVLLKHYREPPRGTGPSLLTFIGHAKDSLWNVDLFRCESTRLQSFRALVIMGQYTRGIVGFGIQRGAVDAPALCRVFKDAIHRNGTPRYLSTDHDPLFKFHRWRANLLILEIDEVKTVPYTPTSHPFVERLIGTIRGELLGHVLFWNTLDLECKLDEFRTYYNLERVPSSLNGNTPYGLASGEVVEAAEFGTVRWRPHCRCLVQLPIAA